METIQFVSIVFETLIVAICIAGAFRLKKTPMLGLALTFAVYVFYDTAKVLAWRVPWIEAFFFLATLSALWSVWSMYSAEQKAHAPMAPTAKAAAKKKRRK